MWSRGRTASFFNQATAGLHFYSPDAKREPSKVFRAVANRGRLWLAVDSSTDGSARVKAPVWDDINNHPNGSQPIIPFNTIYFLGGCFERSKVKIQKDN